MREGKELFTRHRDGAVGCNSNVFGRDWSTPPPLLSLSEFNPDTLLLKLSMHFFGCVTSGGEEMEAEATSRSSDICFSGINVTLLVSGTLEFVAVVSAPRLAQAANLAQEITSIFEVCLHD